MIINTDKQQDYERKLKQLTQNDLRFIEKFDNIKASIETKDLIFLDKVQVNENDLNIVIDAVNLRRNVNDHIKQLGVIEEYKRENETKTNFQAMLVEVIFAKYLWNIYKHTSKYLKSQIEIHSPEMATVFLNHTKEDFYIKNKLNDVTLDFDVKSQFLNNKYNSVNINQNSHKRFLEHESDLYIVGLIDGNPDIFESVKNIYFVLMPLEYFNNNKVDINEPPRPTKRFSPYHRLDMGLFKKVIF